MIQRSYAQGSHGINELPKALEGSMAAKEEVRNQQEVVILQDSYSYTYYTFINNKGTVLATFSTI